MTLLRKVDANPGPFVVLAIVGIAMFLGFLFGGCATGGEPDQLTGPFSGTYQVTRSLPSNPNCPGQQEVYQVQVERVQLESAPNQETYYWQEPSGQRVAFAVGGKLYVEGMDHLLGVNVDTWAELAVVTPATGDLTGSWRIATYWTNTDQSCQSTYLVTAIKVSQ